MGRPPGRFLGEPSSRVATSPMELLLFLVRPIHRPLGIRKLLDGNRHDVRMEIRFGKREDRQERRMGFRPLVRHGTVRVNVLWVVAQVERSVLVDEERLGTLERGFGRSGEVVWARLGRVLGIGEEGGVERGVVKGRLGRASGTPASDVLVGV